MSYISSPLSQLPETCRSIPKLFSRQKRCGLKTHSRSIDPRFIGRSQDGRRTISSWTRIAFGLTSRRRSRTNDTENRMTNSENIAIASHTLRPHAYRCARIISNAHIVCTCTPMRAHHTYTPIRVAAPR